VSKYNSEELCHQAEKAILEGTPRQWVAIAEAIGVPETSLRRNLDELPDPLGDTDTKVLGWHTEEQRVNVQSTSLTSEEEVAFDEFLKRLDPDLDTWEVKQWDATKFTAWRKDEDKDLTFTEGVIDGHVRSGGILSQEFWNLKATFIRRKLISVLPAIEPVQFNTAFTKSPIPDASDEIRRALLLFDAHIGLRKDPRNGLLTSYHDRKALDIACQVAADQWFDVIYIGGDWIDLPEFSTNFDQEPEFHLTTQPTVYEGGFWLARLRSMSKNPDVAVIYVEGNHEFRLTRYIRKYFYAMHDLRPYDEIEAPIVTIPRLLGLDGLGIEWIPGYEDGKAETWLTPQIKLVHGKHALQAGTAKRTLDGSQVSVFFGHTHKKEEYWALTTNERGDKQQIVAASLGWLGKHGEVPGAHESNAWHKGFGVVEYKENMPPKIEQVCVCDGEAICGGKLYKGTEPLSELREAFPDWNWGNE